MLLALSSYHYIIIFSLTIIISYFFNLYAKKSGVPAVLMLIGLGVLINYSLRFSGIGKPDLLPILEVLGVTGLILIVLEAALDLHLLKEKFSLITRSFLSALIAFVATSYLSALTLSFLMDVEVLNVLLYTIPLSILSSAIILPSIDDLSPDKKEFMIYESTFSDIIGIIAFYAVLTVVGSNSSGAVYGEVFGNLALTIVVSVFISYLLIYVFQKITGHGKLFLLIAILLLLYSVGKLFHLSSLIIILIFGVILNNYNVFFGGDFKKFIDLKKVASVLEDMKIITAESAFVVRTFFFIIFGWSVYLGTLLNLKVVGIGLIIILLIYLIRGLILFLFNGKNIFPEIFLAPRGLITILLFFAIPEHLVLGKEFHGILLFVIITSCLIMTWSMISFKNQSLGSEKDMESDEVSGDNEIVD